MTLVFLDTETTSLRPNRRPWEIGLIVRNDQLDIDGQPVETEHSWFVGTDDLQLHKADPMSLKIGRFHQRHPEANGQLDGVGWNEYLKHGVEHGWRVAEQVERLTRDAIVVGAVPNFDTETLDRMLRRHGYCPAWHYHLVDVETLAAGWLRMPPRWDFDKVLAAFGLAYDEADRHTALGDARMVRDLYDKVMASQ